MPRDDRIMETEMKNIPEVSERRLKKVLKTKRYGAGHIIKPIRIWALRNYKLDF